MSNKSNGYQKHLPAASALAAIPLCALQERCLKSAQHQPEIVYGRQKAELSSQHLYALNAPEKTKKTSDLPNWQRIKCAKQHQMRNRKVRPEKKKTKIYQKKPKETCSWHTYLTPTCRFRSKTHFCEPNLSAYLCFLQNLLVIHDAFAQLSQLPLLKW